MSGRHPWLRIAIPALFFAGAAVLLLGVLSSGDDERPSALIGKPAPALELAPLDGHPLATGADLRSDGIKLVNFWASWCAPCRVEHPSLENIAAKGFAIYGVNYKDKPDNAQSFLSELGNPYRAIGADAKGRTAIEWGVYGIPETFLVDGQGRIILRVAGPVTSRVYRDRIAPVLDRAGIEEPGS
ncbi:MAG: DsbE family thiol:disulfide interchange protein [Rhodobacteraceae bacterium]|nr:DsbE family thiol:disulfide interchange protein [Paracoccaceae bacterium]